jgi:hypothetical protein
MCVAVLIALLHTRSALALDMIYPGNEYALVGYVITRTHTGRSSDHIELWLSQYPHGDPTSPAVQAPEYRLVAPRAQLPEFLKLARRFGPAVKVTATGIATREGALSVTKLEPFMDPRRFYFARVRRARLDGATLVLECSGDAHATSPSQFDVETRILGGDPPLAGISVKYLPFDGQSVGAPAKASTVTVRIDLEPLFRGLDRVWIQVHGIDLHWRAR